MTISIARTMSCLLFLSALFTLAMALTAPQARAQTFEHCPATVPMLPAAVLIEKVLDEVCFPDGVTGLTIEFFDDYSWRAFIGLVWPAKVGERGVPDASAELSEKGRPVVFETFKSDWEIFQPQGAAPSAWQAVGGENPCKVANLTSDDLVLAAFSKFNNLGQAGFGPRLVGPLVAQNRTYVRFQTAFNKIEFEQIAQGKLYLRGILKGTMTFQPGAIDIKAAWIDMKDIAHSERFYTREAYLLDLETETCSKAKVGLVGLHIVQKTPSRPQWIWSSFEQVDNILEDRSLSPATFHAGDATPMPDENPYSFPPPVQVPAAFNVDRLKPVHASTAKTNEIYRKMLADAGVPWQFYKLVVTQWPIPIGDPAADGKPNKTFPGSGSSQTAFANLTMETFDQKTIIKGCMNCHNVTRDTTDFLWSLNTRAFPSLQAITARAAMSDKAVTKLSLPNVRLKNWAQVQPASEAFQLPEKQLSEFEALKELMESTQPEE